VGGALLSYVFCKSASLRKACVKHAERLAEKLKPLIFKGFTHFITHITHKRKCIEKTRFLTAKIVPTGGAGRNGGFGIYLYAYAEMRKEFHEVLDFQRFALFRKSFRILSASFPQCVKPLTFNALQI
jgi:hypothetical protein